MMKSEEDGGGWREGGGGRDGWNGETDGDHHRRRRQPPTRTSAVVVSSDNNAPPVIVASGGMLAPLPLPVRLLPLLAPFRIVSSSLSVILAISGFDCCRAPIRIGMRSLRGPTPPGLKAAI